LTGATLLRLATGRTDLPGGDPEALHDSLFEKLLRLDGALQVFPAHNYKGTPVTTLARERAENPRLQRRERAAFVEQMRALSLEMPEHLTEALRTNRTGGKTVAQLLDEAASRISFMSMEEVRERIAAGDRDLLIVDVRERDAYDAGHVPGAPKAGPRHRHPGRAGPTTPRPPPPRRRAALAGMALCRTGRRGDRGPHAPPGPGRPGTRPRT